MQPDTSSKGMGVVVGLALMIFGVPITLAVTDAVAASVCATGCYGEEGNGELKIGATLVGCMATVYLIGLLAVGWYARINRQPAMLRGMGWTWLAAAFPLAVIVHEPLTGWLCGPSCSGDYLVMWFLALIIDLAVVIVTVLFAVAVLVTGSELRGPDGAEPDEVYRDGEDDSVLLPPRDR